MALSKSVLPWGATTAFAFSQSDPLKKFIQPLRGLGPGGIPVAAADSTNPGWWQPGVTHYTIEINQYQDQLHPNLPATTLWGYNPTVAAGGGIQPQKHLGGVIVAQRDTPVQVTFRNKLPSAHILPVDTTIMGSDRAQNRVATHLHGGFVPWISDGGPFDHWGTSDSDRGESFENEVLNPGLAPNEAEYYYPNQQSARMMWYHDHAFGITRLNAYAGIATAYVVTDNYESLLVSSNGLPAPTDQRTFYLVFQDKIFVSSTMKDPTWTGGGPGSLWYAHTYELNRWGPLGPTTSTLPDPSCIPEFFGDTVLVNGTVSPYIEVEQRQYRFRMLNACNARFLNPRLVYAKGTTFPDSTEPTNQGGPGFVQIGNEGGFLPNPALVSGQGQPLLLMAPAERADLIVDFSAVPAGSILILYNDAPAPFPGGDARNDYYPGNNKTPTAAAGYSPNTRTLLQIKVKPRSGTKDAPFKLAGPMTPTDPFLVKQTPGVPTPFTLTGKPTAANGSLTSTATITLAGSKTATPVTVRYLTLNEGFDAYGRLIQYLGTAVVYPTGANPPTFSREYTSAATEVVKAGSLEIWEIANLTADTHPIHFHLVNVQVLSRQPFAAKQYAGGVPSYSSQPIAPDANELGWKETVRMNPGEITRVLMQFNLPAVPFSVPTSNRTGGYEYVWHCHILEHEEHDMMRPLVVLP